MAAVNTLDKETFRVVSTGVSKVIERLLWLSFTTLCHWLKKACANHLTNQKLKQNQS